jgi:hypothetical protein
MDINSHSTFNSSKNIHLDSQKTVSIPEVDALSNGAEMPFYIVTGNVAFFNSNVIKLEFPIHNCTLSLRNCLN